MSESCAYGRAGRYLVAAAETFSAYAQVPALICDDTACLQNRALRMGRTGLRYDAYSDDSGEIAAIESTDVRYGVRP